MNIYNFEGHRIVVKSHNLSMPQDDSWCVVYPKGYGASPMLAHRFWVDTPDGPYGGGWTWEATDGDLWPMVDGDVWYLCPAFPDHIPLDRVFVSDDTKKGCS